MRVPTKEPLHNDPARAEPLNAVRYPGNREACVTLKPRSRYVAEKTDLQCVRCGNDMRRLGRQGFLERKIYSYFGYYPWECPICRERVFLKRKHEQNRRTLAERTVC